MEANELRYGNLIRYKGKIIVVTMIGEHGIQSNNDGVLINAKFTTPDLTPIPLTEEWLLNLGFSMNNETSLMIDNILIYLGQFGKNIVYLTNNLEDDEEIADVNYVHQLQNLFFALKGKELTIKD